jgi:hypothetical protein
MSKTAIRPAAILVPIAAALVSAPSAAATKTFLIGSFEELVVDGDIAVIVDNDKAPSAKATGEQATLDAIRFESNGRQLRIRLQQYAAQSGKASARSPLLINIGGRGIIRVTANGSASVKMNDLSAGGGTAQLRLSGPGSISVGRLESDRINVSLAGSGGISIGGGKARIGQFSLSGPGSIAAAGLALQQASLAQRGSSKTELMVSDRVDITNTGSGEISIAGKATCFVRRQGQARITCTKIEQK